MPMIKGKSTLTEKEGWSPLGEQPAKPEPLDRAEHKRREAEDRKIVEANVTKYLDAQQTTRDLLQGLDDARAGGYWETWIRGEYTIHGFHLRAEQIKEVLATREHIPNKAERKKLRQERAKAQRNR